MLLGAVVFVCLFLASPLVPTASAQDPDPGADTTSVDVVGPVEAPQERSGTGSADDRVLMVIGGLVALAVVVAVASVVFYRRTNPARLAAAEAASLDRRPGV